MEKLNNLLQNESVTGLTNSQEKPSQEVKLPDVWVLALFKKFQGRYLHKWTSAIEDIEREAMQEWSEVLGGLSGEQIKRGLSSWGNDWPPTAHEFRKACEGVESKPYHKPFEKEQIYIANPGTEKARVSAMSDIKKMLGNTATHYK